MMMHDFEKSHISVTVTAFICSKHYPSVLFNPGEPKNNFLVGFFTYVDLIFFFYLFVRFGQQQLHIAINIILEKNTIKCKEKILKN